MSWGGGVLDGTLNTIGHLRYDPHDEVDLSPRGVSGRGYAGAEGYDVVMPRRRGFEFAAE